ncbi:MAG: Tetratricopeptide 4 [Myxococcales bacterium]|nr:Tetratricopeptide 4 [Myxococcales bacterium]
MSEGFGRAAIRRMMRTARLWIWLGLAVVFGLVLGLFPLFGTLGYELALAAAVFSAICGLDLGAALARHVMWTPPGVVRNGYPARALAATTLTASGLAVAISIVPAVICAVRGIWIPTCDWAFGLVSYLAMPLATAALAGALGHAIGVAAGVRERSLLRPHRSTVLALLPLLVLALAGLWRFYAAPPVFIYNPIIGYFPGNLYDENVTLGMPIVWSRLEQLLWLVTIVSVVASRLDVPKFRAVLHAPRPAAPRGLALALAIVCFSAATFMHVHGGTLGYAVDASDIEEVLDGRIETAHFVIHYARTPEIEKDIALIAADHEFRYAQAVAQLGAAPPGKLTSFYFGDHLQKGRWMGARDVEMAKPWRREIYLDHRAYPHPSLRHEIAHAVASEFGDPIFGVASRRILGVPMLVSPGLIEGLAVAVDWPAGYERLTPHESVRAMQVMGLTPTISELLSLRFLAVSSARSYVTAGSFLRYLLDTYGAAKLRALYHSGGEFDEAYGKSVTELENEWRTMIGKIELPADIIEGTRERFRGGSVFARPCPHAIAARREQAAFANSQGDHAHAVALMREVCGDAPEEPSHRLRLVDYLASGTTAEKTEAMAILKTVSDDSQTTSSLRADALDRLGRIAATRGDLKLAIELVEKARTMPIDPSQHRQYDAESLALHDEGPDGAALRGYFFGSNGLIDQKQWAMLAILAAPGDGFGHYLLGLQHISTDNWKEAAEELDTALGFGLPGSLFTKNAARKLVFAAYRAKDGGRMHRAIDTLRGPGMAETDRLLADDWAQRLTFDATGHL